MTYPANGDWWCEDSTRIPHRAPQGSRRCEVHAKEYKRYQDRVRAARARFTRTNPGETFQPPPYAPSGDSNPASLVLYGYEIHDLLTLREDLDAAITRVRRQQRRRDRPEESTLQLADLADRMAAILQEFGERVARDRRARSPADATASPQTRRKPKPTQKDRR